MMEFRLGSGKNVRLCFVSTFRLNVPFRAGSSSDSGLLGAYGDWKADVASKLKEHGSGSFSWSEPKESTSGQQNFVTGCFMEGSAKDLDSFTAILKELDVFAGLSPKVTFLKIKLWEFGFGSVRVGVDFASLEGETVIIIKENKIISKLKRKFFKKLESIIKSDIVFPCKSVEGINSSSQSFAEKVMQHKEEKIKQQVGKLSESRGLVEFNVKDSDFFTQSDLLSKSSYGTCIEENFGVFCLKRKDVIAFLQVGDNDSPEYIVERILVQVSFLQYVSAIGEMYEILFAADFKKLRKKYIMKKSFRFNLILAKLHRKGCESIIVEERRKAILICEEIESIVQVISESNNQINSLYDNNISGRNERIWNYLSNDFNLDALQNIVNNKFRGIKRSVKKIDEIVFCEQLTRQARLSQILIILTCFLAIIVVIVSIIRMLGIGNPQTPDLRDPDKPNNPPTTIETSSPPTTHPTSTSPSSTSTSSSSSSSTTSTTSTSSTSTTSSTSSTSTTPSTSSSSTSHDVVPSTLPLTK